MKPSHHSPTDLPLVAAADLMGEMAEATQAVALAALKLEMEGLAVLFGGTEETLSDAAQAKVDAETEAGFDNMPV